MMFVRIQTTDANASLSLPKSFANATVIVDQVSENELRIRLANVIPADEVPFLEENTVLLTDRERDRFLELLAEPSEPNPALKAAAARHKARHN